MVNHSATTCEIDESAALPLIHDPATYKACQWDLTQHRDRLTYWVALFREHFATLVTESLREQTQRGVAREVAAARCEQAHDAFEQYLKIIEVQPESEGRLDILKICRKREAVLRDAQVGDPYRLAKARENEAALGLFAPLCAQLDAMDDQQRGVRLIQGIFAGNIFDLGATQTQAMFADKSVDFHAVLGKLKPRPWLIDDMDTWVQRWQAQPRHQQALLFVDNAGCDIVLGMLPFARELLRRGTRVILAANATPTLNDVTADELVALVERVAQDDAAIADALAQGTLEIVSSGNAYPLIDMSRISSELAQLATQREVDLLVIEGMGRAVESNLIAAFAVDTLKIAMVKDQGVADALGGELYDLVMRFEPARGVL